MRTVTLSGQDFIVNPLKGKDIKALKAQGFDLMGGGYSISEGMDAVFTAAGLDTAQTDELPFPENAAAWELLQAGATQLRMSGMGGPVGFDYNALALVAEAFGIDLTPGMWRKVQAVETVIRRNAARQAEKTQQASASTR